MTAFFQSPDEWKRRWMAAADTARGYLPPFTEMMSRSIGIDSPSGSFDAVESFNVGTSPIDYPGVRTDASAFSPNVWPDLPQFRRHIDLYFDEVGRVARTVLSMLGDYSAATDHSIDLLRLNHYLEHTGEGMSAHEDFGLLSVIHEVGAGGLEVAVDRVWTPVVVPTGALVVFVDEALSALSGGRLRPALHRVRPQGERMSAIYFHEGNADAVIAPGRTIGAHVVEKAGAVRRGRAAVWDEHALSRLPPR